MRPSRPSSVSGARRRASTPASGRLRQRPGNGVARSARRSTGRADERQVEARRLGRRAADVHDRERAARVEQERGRERHPRRAEAHVLEHGVEDLERLGAAAHAGATPAERGQRGLGDGPFGLGFGAQRDDVEAGGAQLLARGLERRELAQARRRTSWPRRARASRDRCHADPRSSRRRGARRGRPMRWCRRRGDFEARDRVRRREDDAARLLHALLRRQTRRRAARRRSAQRPRSRGRGPGRGGNDGRGPRRRSPRPAAAPGQRTATRAARAPESPSARGRGRSAASRSTVRDNPRPRDVSCAGSGRQAPRRRRCPRAG